MTVKFTDVGRHKKSWTEDIPELNYSSLKKAVHGKKAIGSRHPDFEIDGTRGKIFAGWNLVGLFEILTP